MDGITTLRPFNTDLNHLLRASIDRSRQLADGAKAAASIASSSAASLGRR
jgi:hypothetical protein